MGSGGRGESFLYPDQDNGFIIDDYPDAEHGRIDAYFIELAERFNRDLAAIGFPYCLGYVMARNPLWRKTRSQWRDQTALWGSKRKSMAIQMADIFFDFRAAYGERHWAEELRRNVTAMARDSPGFLTGMAEEAQRSQVGLGWFNRLLVEKGDGPEAGAVNLKLRGTLPLVTHLRLLALSKGITATSSLARLDGLYEIGHLRRNEWDALRAAFDHISFLLLRQQLADFKDPAREVSNFVHPDQLTRREKDLLIDSLQAIESFARGAESEFTGQIL